MERRGLNYANGKSGRGQPHSKTWRKVDGPIRRASVVECGGPLPLWNSVRCDPTSSQRQSTLKHCLLWLILSAWFFASSNPFNSAFAASSPANTNRPNILIILADDLGWSDIGCYGSEIKTPNIDSLATHGLRFTQFYNSARCCPSRASLLTGLHPHQAGVPDMNGPLNKECVTIPEVLKPAGYNCYMVGKWHLGRVVNPVVRGFDEFYGMLGGFNSCWQEHPYYTRLPDDRPKRNYATNQFYSTDVFGDYALDFIDAGHASKKPWFMYLAFNAAHFPLHAYEKDIEKYEPVYAQGWDKIREQRLSRQKKLGIVPKSLSLPPRSNIPLNKFNAETGWADKDNPAWDSLPADRRKDLGRRMAVYAAMIDRMDQNIGRVIAHLKQTAQFENTFILFLSDNGACAEWDPYGFDLSSSATNILHHGKDLKKVGSAESYVSYGSGWANARNTPWRLYKHYGHEGGIATPAIIHWPAGVSRPGKFEFRPSYLTDIMATCLELSGAKYPTERNARVILPTEGLSLVPLLTGKRVPERPIFMEHEGNRVMREDKWKLVALAGKPWELYDMEKDRVEMNNLVSRHSEKVKELEAEWNAWAQRAGVTPKPRTPSTSEPTHSSFDLTD
jgi:arylsulfatase A-like enzyme